MRNFILYSIFFLLSLPAFAQEPFITTWETTTADESITIPTYSGYTYDYAVDWGDGSVESNFTGNATHLYQTAGTHTVSISGGFPAIYFRFSPDADKLKTLEQWGDIEWLNMFSAFYGCSELTSNAIDVPNLSQVTQMNQMFRGASVFNGDLSTWDVSAVTEMSGMFYNAAAFNGDLSSWDVSAVTDMSGMFNYASVFNGDISSWDVSAVTNMSGMFSGTAAFNSDLSTWDVSAVTNMSNMFYSTSAFNSDISSWDVSAVTDMGSMFDYASAFNSDLSTWDVSAVTRMSYMFYNTAAFNRDLSNWDVSAVTDMSGMFYDAAAFNRDLSTWDVSAVTDMGSMFRGASVFTGDLSTWDVSAVTDMSRMFWDASVFTGHLSTWDVSAVTDMSRMFSGTAAFTSDLSTWDVSAVTSMNDMFHSAAAFNGDLSTWDVSSVTDMNEMFRDALNFNSDLSTWDVSAVTDMRYMFYGAAAFNSDLSTWDVSAVTNMGSMFRRASVFNGDLSTWDVSAVTNMSYMFRNADAFNGDLSNWDVSSVTNMSYMFFSAFAFTSDLRAWDISSVTDMSRMFSGASAFTSDLSNWDVSSVTNMSYMFFRAFAFTSDLSTWDVSAVTDMSYMFYAAAFNSDLSTWDVSAVTDMSRMFSWSGMLTENYDKTLIGWSTLSEGETQIPMGLTLGATNIFYCNSDTERSTLINTYDWVIIDEGQNCPPVPDDENLTDLTGECSIETAPTAPTAIDPIDGEIIGLTSATFPLTTYDEHEVVWEFTNSAGNKVIQVQKVIFTDVTAPVADVVTLLDITSECAVSVLTAPSATDNCNGIVTVTHNADLPITGPDPFTITWTYTDGNGNISTQTQNVTVTDVIAPVPDVVSLPDVTAECKVTKLTAPTAIDNCSGKVTVTHDADFPITALSSSTITWTFTDGNGNTSTQTQNVIITDEIAPEPDALTLSDITAQCEVTELTAPTATDNCSGEVTVTNNAILPITEQGTTDITWTYKDENGNSSTQLQKVIIEDITLPVPDALTLSDITTECEVTELTAPTATDNCSGEVTVTHDATLPITVQGTTDITWTYTDENGNESTQLQKVIIEDVTIPIPDVTALSDITAQCEVTELTAPAATDNCSGEVIVTNDAVLPITVQGTTNITWTYTDANGNSSTQLQKVIIEDITLPVPDALTLSDITGQCEVTELTAPAATDNCSGDVTVTHDASLPITVQGTTDITWTYTDANGNESTQLQKVIIEDVTAPVPAVVTLAEVTSEVEVTELIAPTALDNCSGEIAGTHDIILPITDEGSTLVTWIYTDEAGNESTQTQEVVITFVTGLTDIAEDLSIYPNPVKNSFGLSGFAIDELAILDLNGKVVQWHKSPQPSYDISDLQSGIYTVVVWSNSKRQFLKMVKE